MPNSNLRERLRTETRAAHDAVDAIFGRFDLTDPAGLAGFLAAHRAAFGLLHRATARGALSDALAFALRDIDADLVQLEQDAGPSVPPAPRNLAPQRDDETARRYLWQGSRLGTRMLARQWNGATHPKVRAAGRYFGAPVRSEDWQALCRDLSERPATGADADRIVGATQGWFAVFAEAGRRQAARNREDA